MAAVQILPASTWLPPVRRLVRSLSSPMSSGTVAITFDDGPHPQGTPAILDALDSLGWTATFFMLGSQVRRYPDVAAEVARRRHAVALHGDDHRYLLGRGFRDCYDDMARGLDSVAEVTGVTPSWWRPPYGVLSTTALAAARRLRLTPLLWSTWGRDWRADTTGAEIADTVSRGRIDGGTVLLHDSDVTSSTGSWRRTLDALPLVDERLRQLDVVPQPLPRQRSHSPGSP